MQRENLYKLQRTVYFIYEPLLFKISEILCNEFSTLRKEHFLLHEQGIPFSVIYYLIRFHKKTEYTTRYSVKSSTICKVKFCANMLRSVEIR